MGIWDNTVLIVTSDHGEALFERGIYQHPAHYLFNELLHVPLLVRVPNESRCRIDRPFSLAWLHELIAEITGINSPSFPAKSGIEEHLTKGQKKAVSPIIADSLDTAGHSIALIDPPHKLVKHYDGKQSLNEWVGHLGNAKNTNWIDDMQDNYYNIKEDQHEASPSNGKNAPDKLLSLVEEIQTDAKDIQRIQGQLSKDTLKQLADLGYR